MALDQQVVITCGPLAGMTGVIIRVEGCHIVVALDGFAGVALQLHQNMTAIMALSR